MGGKYYPSSARTGKIVGMKEMKTVHFPYGNGESDPNFSICIFDIIIVVFDSKRLPFVVSLLANSFAISMRNSNRCDELLRFD